MMKVRAVHTNVAEATFWAEGMTHRLVKTREQMGPNSFYVESSPDTPYWLICPEHGVQRLYPGRVILEWETGGTVVTSYDNFCKNYVQAEGLKPVHGE